MKKLCTYALAVFSLVITAQEKNFKRTFVPYTAKSSMVAPPSAYYSFSTFTTPYQNISGTIVSGGLKWDEPEYAIPVGFNFKLYNMQNDTIVLQGGSYATFNDLVNDPLLTAASPMFEDLCDKAYDPNNDNEGDPGGISNISYVTTGAVGSRICKIEVNNAGFYGENSNSTPGSSVNFQLWLYETSNDIEFRFGATTILNPSVNFLNTGGFICGLVDDLDFNTVTATNSNLLNGAHANPTMVGLSPTASDIITGTPQNGRVYRFANTTITSVKNNSIATGIKVYPNPAKDKLFISNISSELNNATIEFYDIVGKQVHSEKLNAQIDLSAFNKGIYLVKVRTENNESVFMNKIVITD